MIAATSSAFGHPAILGDRDPATGQVEVSLVATAAKTEYLPGKPANVWAYRDGSAAADTATIPGPMLQLRVGDHVTVHFRNELPEATTIHWHGIRVPPAHDGTPIAQVPVPPGGTFDYVFTADDAGTFWYHPHVKSDSQIERGLYGTIVVDGGDEVRADDDRMFVLDDVKLEATGLLSERTAPLDLMLGRQGNVLLVSGRRAPSFETRPGARERWRFVNSANGRYFNLRLPGHTFQVIAWDGGLLAEPYETETLLVAPGERYEVLVTLDGAAGDELALQTIHYDRGHDIPDPGPQDLLHVRLAGPASSPVPTRKWGTFAAIPVNGQTPRRSLVLDEMEEGLPEPRFTINGQSAPDVPPIVARSGDVEVWEIRNDAPMDHPFHLHGMFFQLVDIDGVAPAHRGWKDTINVPMKKTVRVAVRYGAAGKWMYHCHILEHAERGMMGELMLQ